MLSKSINFLLLPLFVILSLMIVLSACSIAGDPPELTYVEPPQSVSFTDTDGNIGEIGGAVTIVRASDEYNVDYYCVYLGTPENTKKVLITEIPRTGGDLLYLLPPNTPLVNVSQITVYTRNDENESKRMVSTSITDHEGNPPSNFAKEIIFSDNDNNPGIISGEVRIYRAAVENDITAYRLYYTNSDFSKLSLIKEIDKPQSSAISDPYVSWIVNDNIQENGYAYFFVRTKNSIREMPDGTSLQITDLTGSAPEHKPVNVIFTDTDPDAGEISGTVIIGRADNETDITHYCLYRGTGPDTVSGSVLCEMEKEDSLRYNFANNTVIPAGVTHLIVKAKNSFGEMTEGVSCILNDNNPGNDHISPLINSFTSDYRIILVQGSVRDFTPLHVSASDNKGISSYGYEIVSGSGSLMGGDTADGKIYFSGNSEEETVVRVTVTDTSGNTAQETLSIYVKEHGYQKISDMEGGFESELRNTSFFGCDVTDLGDLNEDGTSDIAVGARLYDDGSGKTGAVWILFLNPDCTVKSHQKLNYKNGNLTGILNNSNGFGSSVSNLGDLNGDGITDLLVGAIHDNDGGSASGAVWILFLNTDGTVKDYQKISRTQGNFTGIIDSGDLFGFSSANLGDIDGDNVSDIAVGTLNDNDGGSASGAVWILFLNTDGTIKDYQKISSIAGGFTGTLDDSDYFSHGLTCIGDLDSDGINDIAVGAMGDDDSGSGSGAVWIIFLKSDGTVKGFQKISSTQGNFSGGLENNDAFGSSVSSIDDFNNDNIPDIAVGSRNDVDGGIASGAVWLLFLNTDGTIKSHYKISSTEGNFNGKLEFGDFFGKSSTLVNDFDLDGRLDIVIGAMGDEDGGSDRGAIWILLLNPDGTVVH